MQDIKKDKIIGEIFEINKLSQNTPYYVTQ